MKSAHTHEEAQPTVFRAAVVAEQDQVYDCGEEDQD